MNEESITYLLLTSLTSKIIMEKKTDNIYAALSRFQEQCPAINKGAQGYGYKYADLPTIMQIIDPILRKNGLVLSQPMDGRSVVTVLTHIKTEQKIHSSIEIPDGVVLKGMNQFQSDGSAITYYRRYGLSALLSIVVDDDADAAGVQVSQPAEKVKQKITKTAKKSFQHCVERYNEGMSRTEMEEHVTISDSVWKEIVVESNRQNKEA